MKIHVIGDSISIQYGPHLKQALTGICEYSRKLGEEEAMKNLDLPQGANGGDSARVLNYLKAMEQRGGIDADLLLLNCGLHDIRADKITGAHQVPLGDYATNLREILQVAQAMELDFIWIRTTPFNEAGHNATGRDYHRFAQDGQNYNAAADEIMREAGVPMIDLFTFTQSLDEDLYTDHVHFTEPVRQLQAAYIAGWVAAYLQASDRTV